MNQYFTKKSIMKSKKIPPDKKRFRKTRAFPRQAVSGSGEYNLDREAASP